MRIGRDLSRATLTNEPHGEPYFLLDTNTWIYALKGQPASLVASLGTVDPASVVFCSIVKAELLYGAQRHDNQEKRFAILHDLFQRHRSYEFDDGAESAYGRIRHGLERSGRPIGPMDMLTAAIAVANDLTLVTHNTVEFARVPDLRLVDWVR